MIEEILNKILTFEVLSTSALFLSSFIVFSLVWTIVHEFSHLIAAKLTCGTRDWEMKVLPCKLNGIQVGGFVRYWPARKETNNGRGIVSGAPFITSTLACIALPIAAMTGSVIFIAFLLNGIIDHMVGFSAESNSIWDLCTMSKKLNISIWLLRVCGFLIAATSLFISTVVFMKVWIL